MNSETLVRNHAALLSNQPEVEGAFADLETNIALLVNNKNTLGLQELSLYTANFKSGDLAYYYGGPVVTRRLQVSAGCLISYRGIIHAVVQIGKLANA